MAAAADRDELLPEPPEGMTPTMAAWAETVRTRHSDLAAAFAKVSEALAERMRAEANDPDLRPLKSLLTPSEYEAARRVRRNKSGVLRMIKRGGRLYSKPVWVADWKRLTRGR